MYTPHEKTDGLLRRIFQTCYGRTDSKKISADCANLVRSMFILQHDDVRRSNTFSAISELPKESAL